MKYTRGRPKEPDNTIILQYTQNFKEHTGVKYKWIWDLTKSNGPITVEIEDPQFHNSEKLLRELLILEKKYEPSKKGRKPRITKIDKLRMEQIQKELDEFHYSLYPEDRPKVRGRKPKI